MPGHSYRCEAWSPITEDDGPLSFSYRCGLQRGHRYGHIATFIDDDDEPMRVRWPDGEPE